MSVGKVLGVYRGLVEPRLQAWLPSEDLEPVNLHRAMRYAVLGGGKRLRPALSMASAVALGGRPEDALDVGCAAEFVHCFSLVHDDLPAIDNDDLRRGSPTVHRAFTEATAVLAGDALFARAFEILGTLENPRQAATCLRVLARASGGLGLVGGEVLDVESEGQDPELALVEMIHRRKTGALISASCEMGGAMVSTDEAELAILAEFGMELGLAFQIIDDVLNVTSSSEQLGKSAGSDEARCKSTYPAVLGVEPSKDLAYRILDMALGKVRSLPGNTHPLEDLALSCVERDS